MRIGAVVVCDGDSFEISSFFFLVQFLYYLFHRRQVNLFVDFN
jgi:hypothetical protein